MSGVLAVVGSTQLIFDAGASSGMVGTTFELLFRTDGTARATHDGTTIDFNWVNPEAPPPGPYHIRLTVNTGSSPDTGPAEDTDHPLTANREWTWAPDFPGGGTNVTITLKSASGGVVLDTGNHTASYPL